MKKCEFNAPSIIIGYNSSIRDKISIIRILISVIRYLNTGQEIGEQKESEKEMPSIHITICIDKMSRVFLEEKDKIHSFAFPFTIIKQDANYVVQFLGIDITSPVCAVMEATFYKIIESSSVEDIVGNFWDAVRESEVDDEDRDLCCQLLTYLLSFEPGYVRYDHDEVNAGHPIDHLDINYTNMATFKLPLNQSIDCGGFIRLIGRDRVLNPG